MSFPSVTVREETETDRGWSFAVEIAPAATTGGGDTSESCSEPDGPVRTVTVALSWVDYDHLSGGSASPALVVRAIVEEALERGVLSEFGERFDAARADRRSAGLLDAARARL